MPDLLILLIKFRDDALELLRIGKLFLCVADRDNMFQVLLDKIRKSVIIDQVGIGRNLFDYPPLFR